MPTRSPRPRGSAPDVATPPVSPEPATPPPPPVAPAALGGRAAAESAAPVDGPPTAGATARGRTRVKREVLPGGPWLDFEKPVVELELKIAELRSHAADSDLAVDRELAVLTDKVEKLRHRVYDNLTRYQRVQLA
ncbi:MAG: hypothetical protein ABIP29_07145, partial [Candidatus Eisenbacteria bacterium]